MHLPRRASAQLNGQNKNMKFDIYLLLTSSDNKSNDTADQNHGYQNKEHCCVPWVEINNVIATKWNTAYKWI